MKVTLNYPQKGYDLQLGGSIPITALLMVLKKELYLGLASAMQTINLLQTNYSKLDGFHLEDYIRSLRRQVLELQVQNDFMSNTEQNMPDILEDKYIKRFDHTIKKVEDFDTTLDYYAVTATIDPNRFKNIQLVPQGRQINYFKKIISKLLYDKTFTNIYGSFEQHQTGVIHFHGVIAMYHSTENAINLKHSFARHLTNNPRNKHNTLIKCVDDLHGWLDYIHKSPILTIKSI